MFFTREYDPQLPLDNTSDPVIRTDTYDNPNECTLMNRCLCKEVVIILALSVAPVVIGCSARPGHASTVESCHNQIEKKIQKIGTETDEDRRIGLSLELAYYVRDHRTCARNPRIVNELAVLLKDSSDGVRISAAMALSYIGPSAARVVPALERAIKESDATLDADTTSTVLPVTSSGSAARDALRQITGKKVPDYVEGWKRKK